MDGQTQTPDFIPMTPPPQAMAYPASSPTPQQQGTSPPPDFIPMTPPPQAGAGGGATPSPVQGGKDPLEDMLAPEQAAPADTRGPIRKALELAEQYEPGQINTDMFEGAGTVAENSTLGLINILNKHAASWEGSPSTTPLSPTLDSWIQRVQAQNKDAAGRNLPTRAGQLTGLALELELMGGAVKDAGVEGWEGLTNSQQWKELSKMRDLAESPSVAGRVFNHAMQVMGDLKDALGTVGETKWGGRLARFAGTAALSAPKWGAETFGQSFLNTGGDTQEALREGKYGAAAGLLFGPLGEMASNYIRKMRSGLVSGESGLIESLLKGPEEIIPGRPGLRPSPPTKPPYPPMQPLEMERPGLAPQPPAAAKPPRKPAAPALITPAERRPMPLPPQPIAAPEPITPTDVGAPPPKPEPYQPNRAPAEARLAQQEQTLAQQTFASKVNREAQVRAGDVGDPDESAAALRILNDQIDHESFASRSPDAQAKILEDRAELLRRAQPASDPRSASEVLAQVGNLQDAADALMERPRAAYQDWNRRTGGDFVKWNEQLQDAKGKFDTGSLKDRAEAEANLNAMNKALKVADPLDREVYRSQFADGYVLQDAHDAITKSFKGADRTGGLDPASLQRNWKSFVNGYGPERVKNVFGEDYYHDMNQFVNDMAGESDADKLAAAKIKTQYDIDMANYRQRVTEAKTLDEAKQAALDAKHAEEVAQQQAAHQQEQQATREFNQQARIKDRQARAQRNVDIQTMHQNWQDQVLATDNLNAAQDAAHQGERQAWQQRKIEYAQAKGAHAQAYKETVKEPIDEAHRQALLQHNLDVQEWQGARNRAYWNRVVAGAGGAGLLALSRRLPGKWGKTAEVVGGAMELYPLLTSPTALRIASEALAHGAKPEVVAPLIQSIMGPNQPKPTSPEEQINEQELEGEPQPTGAQK